MTEDRRVSPRHTAYLVAEIDGETIAITRDVSVGGLLILTRVRLAIGTTIKLKVGLSDGDHVLSGKVVREEDVDPDVSTLWRTKLAITVDPEDPVLKKLLVELAEKQARPPTEA
jgi:hypothetical protein